MADVAAGVALLLLHLLHLTVSGQGYKAQQGLTNPTKTTEEIQTTTETQEFVSPSDLLDHLLDPKRYDTRLRPFFEGPPLNVTVNFLVKSLDSIDEVKMDYSMNIYLRQKWRDPRLRFGNSFSFLVLPPNSINKIWIPDLFFSNEKRAYFHDITVPNRYVRISPNGEVLYSVRLTAVLSCPMLLNMFPHDIQKCSAFIESYGYSTQDIRFEWSSDAEPVQLSEDLELPQFFLEGKSTEECTKTYETGQFTCLKVTFYLKREFGFYLLQMYVPSILIVVLSWVSFWINCDAVPARISLGVTTVLTMTTQRQGQNVPRVSYVKAIDVWMSTCMFFVFAALMEFAFVNVVQRQRSNIEKKRKKHDTLLEKADEQPFDPPPHTLSIAIDSAKSCGDRSPSSTFRTRFFDFVSGERIDKVSRVIFPLVFSVFNLFYWPYYLVDR